MIKRIGAALLPLLAAACNPAGSPSIGDDGYRYETSEFDRKEMTVTVVTYPSAKALQARAREIGISPGTDRALFGFGFVHPIEPSCTIHIVEPAADWRPAEIGHEFVHCMRGRWHSNGGE